MINQLWRFLHNCISHPLLFFANDSVWAQQFHDWSSIKMYRSGKYVKLYVRNNV